MRATPAILAAIGAACAVVTTACIPFPHREWDWPEIDGHLERDGQPSANVPVGLTVQNGAPACQGDQTNLALTGPCRCIVGQTSDAGSFHVESDAHLDLFVWYGDKLDGWTLCFALPEGAARWNGAGMWGGPRSEQLHCHVARDPVGDAGLAAICDPAAP